MKSEKKPKSAPDAYSIADLSRKTGADRAVVARICATLAPAGKSRGHVTYRLSDVLAALSTKPDKSLREQKLAEEIRKLKLANDKAENKVLDKSVYVHNHQRILGPLDTLIEHKLVNEWPAAVAGLDVPQARVYGKRLADDLRAGLRELLEQLPP